jgi:hypothetical protein
VIAAEHRRWAEHNLTQATNHVKKLDGEEFMERETLALIRSQMAIAHALLAAFGDAQPSTAGGSK